MLSRTAETLYWTARYIERADTLARNLEVAYRMSLMPSVSSASGSEWQSILATSNLIDAYNAEFDEVNQTNIEKFLVYSTSNQASIRHCIRAARNNAREVRTALTSDVWSALNQMYLDFNVIANDSKSLELPALCDWVKQHASTVRGSFFSTQLRSEGFDFFNLGTHIERSDNTARILDIKYYVLLPTIEMVGGGVDRYQWTTLLRAMSSYRSYYWLYSGDYSAEKIADFFILNRSCPRSLQFCVIQAAHHLEMLSSAHGRYNEAQMLALKLKDELSTVKINEIIDQGLHEFLQGFLASTHRLNQEISQSFLFGTN